MIYKKIKIKSQIINYKQTYTGNPLEREIEELLTTGKQMEETAPILYFDKKDGVRPETNIRTDKWKIAQNAMTAAAEAKQKKRDAIEKKEKDIA